jgi:hypothetical protein
MWKPSLRTSRDASPQQRRQVTDVKTSRAGLARIGATHPHPGFHGPVLPAQPILWPGAPGEANGTGGRCVDQEDRA